MTRFALINSVIGLLVLIGTSSQALAQAGPLPDEIDPRSIACNSTGTLVATARLGGSLKITDTASGKVVISLEKESVKGIVFSPDERLLATLDEKGIELWVLAKGQAVSKGYLHIAKLPLMISSIAFSPDSKILAIGSIGVNRQAFDSYGEVSLWDVGGGKRLRSLKGMDGVYSLAFSPDGKLLALGTGQGSAHGFPLPKGGVQLWDVQSGGLRLTLKLAKRINWVEAVAFSPDGKTLAASASPTVGKSKFGVQLWDVATGKERSFLKGHDHAFGNLVFSADGSKLAATDIIETIVWDTTTAKELGSLNGVMAPVTFSKDGKRLATLLHDGSVEWNDIDDLTNVAPQK